MYARATAYGADCLLLVRARTGYFARADLTPELRASDAEREALVSRLREQCAAGRLTIDELAERSAAT